MARVPVVITQAPGIGTPAVVTWTAADIVEDHTLFNDGETSLIVRNPDGVEVITVTVESVECSHGRTGDIVQAVATETTRVFGPFPKDLFNQANGVINVDLAGAAAGVQLAAIRQRV